MDTENFKLLLQNTAEEFRTTLRVDLNELAIYTSEQIAALSAAVGQPGYNEAVITARNNIALKAGIQATREADAADQRILGIVQAVLVLGVSAI